MSPMFGNPGITPASVVDLGAQTLDKRYSLVNPEDDNFDSPFLNPRWILYNSPTIDLTTLPGWIGIGLGGGKGILQPVPSGDWTIETEAMQWGYTGTSGTEELDVILSTSTNPASMTGSKFLVYRDTTTTATIQHQKIVNNAYNAQYTGSPLNSQTGYVNRWFIRINKAGTTYTISISDTGKQWYRIFQEASLGFTPAYFGLMDGWFNYFIRR